jgi:lipid-A-disaccharide synthase-like uncharacterized protein
MTEIWPWLAIVLMGAYHGLNPAMGWLFAVSLGLQEGSRSRVIAALWPIAIGHLISVALVVALVAWLELVVNPRLLAIAGGSVLLGFGALRLFSNRFHYRWVGMRVSGRDLVLWSFLMASAHGAGLMLFPILIDTPVCSSAAALGAAASGSALTVVAGAAAVIGVHTVAMLAVMAAVALLVYDRLGLAILRSAWINLDKLWAATLAACGLIVILL